jgi:hypothetical protein
MQQHLSFLVNASQPDIVPPRTVSLQVLVKSDLLLLKLLLLHFEPEARLQLVPIRPARAHGLTMLCRSILLSCSQASSPVFSFLRRRERPSRNLLVNMLWTQQTLKLRHSQQATPYFLKMSQVTQPTHRISQFRIFNLII